MSQSRKKPTISVKVKLSAVLFFILIFTVTAHSFMLIVSFQRAYRLALEEKSYTLGQDIRRLIYKNLRYFPLDSFAEMNTYLSGIIADHPGISYCFITDAEGRIIYHTESGRLREYIDRGAYRDFYQAGMAHNTTLAIGRYYESLVPLIWQDEPIGAVHIGIPQRTVNAPVRRMQFMSLGLLLAALVISVFLFYQSIARIVITPLSRLLEVIKYIISRKTFEKHIEPAGRDEIGELATVFNTMTDELHQYYLELQKTTDELKNEVLQRMVVEKELVRHRHNLEDMVQERTEELHKSEKRFRLLFENAKDAIVWANPGTGNIIHCNKAAEELFERPRQELVGAHQTLLHPPEKAQHYADVFKNDVVIKGGISEDIEIVTKSGQVRQVHLMSSLTEVSGEPIIQGIFRDITERKQAEQHLREAMEFKSKLTSVVSHELRTPLAAIKASINLVMDEWAGVLGDQQKDFLTTAQRNVERLNRLINDVLDFQQLESGSMKFHPQENNLNEVVAKIHELMLPLSQRKGLEFSLKLDPNLPAVQFDRDRIFQMMENLVDNAIKFTDKGQILISTACLDDCVQVSVRDSGIGIPGEDIPKLFHSFEQLDRAWGRKTGGTGLGLAICWEIVQNHKGNIWAESEGDQKGSLFIFTLPRRRVEAA